MPVRGGGCTWCAAAQMLAMALAARVRLAEEWSMLISEMDVAVRVCHDAGLDLAPAKPMGPSDGIRSRPRTISFRGTSFVQPRQTAPAPRLLPPPVLFADRGCQPGKAVLGYFRLPEGHGVRCSGAVQHSAVALRCYMRHPSWPDPDTALISFADLMFTVRGPAPWRHGVFCPRTAG